MSCRTLCGLDIRNNVVIYEMRKTKRAHSRTRRRYAKKVRKTNRTRKRRGKRERRQKRRRLRGGAVTDLQLTQVTVARLLTHVNKLQTQVAGIEQRCCPPSPTSAPLTPLSPTSAPLTPLSSASAPASPQPPVFPDLRARARERRVQFADDPEGEEEDGYLTRAEEEKGGYSRLTRDDFGNWGRPRTLRRRSPRTERD